jgi:hypothetical protein
LQHFNTTHELNMNRLFRQSIRVLQHAGGLPPQLPTNWHHNRLQWCTPTLPHTSGPPAAEGRLLDSQCAEKTATNTAVQAPTCPHPNKSHGQAGAGHTDATQAEMNTTIAGDASPAACSPCAGKTHHVGGWLGAAGMPCLLACTPCRQRAHACSSLGQHSEPSLITRDNTDV